MVGWHHRLNGHGFEQALGDSEGQGGLACCSPWGHKESDTAERLNNPPPQCYRWFKEGCHFQHGDSGLSPQTPVVWS